MIVRHSTFKLGADAGISSVFQLGNGGGPTTDFTIEDCLLDGGGYVIGGGDNNVNAVVQNNRVTRRSATDSSATPTSRPRATSTMMTAPRQRRI